MRYCKLFYLLVLLGMIVSCNKSNEKSDNDLPVLFPEPKVVELNLEGGYKYNQFGGQELQPLINSVGDTVISGKPIILNLEETPLKGEIRSIPFEFHFEDTIKSNVHIIPENLSIQSLTFNDLENRRLNTHPEKKPVLNPIGDTIISGIPLKIEPVEQPYYYTEPQEILDFSILPDANTDIQYLDMEHGLKSSYIRSLFHDSKGHIWIGSDGAGLAKYDGETIGYLSNNDNLKENTIFSIMEDQNGNIWASSYSYPVFKFDGTKFTSYTQENGMPNDFICAVFEDSRGNIWFGSIDQGISRFDGENFIHLTTNEGLSDNSIQSFSEDKNGNIIVSTNIGGLAILNQDLIGTDSKSLFQIIDISNGLGSNQIHDAICDNEGNIWIGTYGAGLYKYTGEELIHYDKETGLSGDFINDLYLDKTGKLWIGTYDGGLSLYNPPSSLTGKASFTHITDKEGLSNNIVLNVTEDLSGKILIGTDGGGLNRYNPNSFENFTEKEGLGIKYINDIYEDKEGVFWLATWGAGIDVIKNDQIGHMKLDEDNYSSTIWEIEERENGQLMFATAKKGIMFFKDNEISFINKSNGLPQNYVRAVSEDKNGVIWAGFNKEGVARISGDRITIINHEQGLGSNRIASSFIDNQGNLWVGTRTAGVTKISGDTLINYTEKEGLSNNTVWSINQDSRGNMWFGTESGGLNMFDGEKFTYFGVNEGIQGVSVSSITEDRNGTIWLGTTNGLSSITYEFADETRDNNFLIRNYGRQDGLKGVDFYTNSSLLDSENNLWFGTGKSLAKRSVSSFDNTASIPAPQLNWISINEQLIDFRNLPDSLSDIVLFDEVAPFNNYPKNLSIPHYYDHLSFNFSAIDWNSPHQIKYSFRIKELKKSWSKPSKETKAEYRNIPPGDYTFEFIACGHNGIWSEPFELQFEIRPPWWKTTTARILFALAFLLLIVLIFRWRTRQLKIRQKMLVQEVKSATKEIREQKAQVEKAHAETEKQKEIIEESHKEITDSIAYAKKLQDAILPSLTEINSGFENSFVLFQPKDVVSGDFYWYEKVQVDGKVKKYIAAADCTGHGVPGALVSVVCSNALNRSLNEFGIQEPHLILNKARELVIKTFAKSGDGVKDGMDISLCCIEGDTLKYAGANNPIWIVRNTAKLNAEQKSDPKTLTLGELSLIEFKADKQPVGMQTGNQTPFKQTEIQVLEGDSIYLFTDGFPDQFGGDKGKKYKYKPFKKLLLEINQLSFKDQETRLLKELNDWKGHLEQVDDVCIIGFKK